MGLEVTSHIKTLGSWREEGGAAFSLLKFRSIPPVMTPLVPEIRLQQAHLETGCLGHSSLLRRVGETGEIGFWGVPLARIIRHGAGVGVGKSPTRPGKEALDGRKDFPSPPNTMGEFRTVRCPWQVCLAGRRGNSPWYTNPQHSAGAAGKIRV